MAYDFESDIEDNFLNVDEHADAVVYTPVYGAPKTINAIVTSEYDAVDLADMASVSSYSLMAFCKTSDLTGTVMGGTIRHNSTDYRIISRADQDGGITMLGLSVE